jgi:hypothetical protein
MLASSQAALRMVIGSLAILVSVPCSAEQAPDPDTELVTYFYKDARPERLSGFIARFQDKPIADRPQVIPALTGFLAAVCTSYPDKFAPLIPTDLKPRMSAIVALAVKLCGNASVAAAVKPKLDQAKPDERMLAAFSGLPSKLDDLRVMHPTHLDILWSASFVQGDQRYVAVIADFFAQVANQSEAAAVDIAQTVLEMTGGPKGTMAQLRGKYGDDGARRMIYAASALWALQSNARQHAFVDQFLTKYIADHPDTPATKALATLRPRR